MEFVKDALRRLISEYTRKEELLPPLEHFNLREDGVLILDRTLNPNAVVEVYFRPDGVYCELCESRRCKHVDFALGIPKVKEILRKKGWKIERRPSKSL